MEPNEATVVVGSNLRVRSANSAWRELGLAGLESVTGKRIDEVFPATDIRGSILDVLASGDSLRGVVIPVGSEGAERYFCATLDPIGEIGAKPRDVVVSVVELEGRLVVEGEAARIIEMNEIAARALGRTAAAVQGKSVWTLQPFDAVEVSAASGQAAESHRSRYLGRWRFTGATGETIELEGAMVPIGS